MFTDSCFSFIKIVETLLNIKMTSHSLIERNLQGLLALCVRQLPDLKDIEKVSRTHSVSTLTLSPLCSSIQLNKNNCNKMYSLQY